MYFSKEYYRPFVHSRGYPIALGVTAFFLMIFGLVPFEVILVPAVAADPKRWRRVFISGAIGSALGAVALESLFHRFGWPLVNRLFPSLGPSKEWGMLQSWISHFGGWALIAAAALPIAQTPVLIVAGLFRVPELDVLGAYLIGKLVRYSIESLIVSKGEIKLKKELPPS